MIVSRWNISRKFLIYSAAFFLQFNSVAVLAAGGTPQTMTVADAAERLRILKKLRTRVCNQTNLLSSELQVGSSFFFDTLPLVPLAWTGFQKITGDNERIKSKIEKSGSVARLMIFEGIGGGLLTISMVVPVLFESLIAKEDPYGNKGANEVIDFLLEGLEAAYSNSKTARKAFEFDQKLRADTCYRIVQDIGQLSQASEAKGSAAKVRIHSEFSLPPARAHGAAY